MLLTTASARGQGDRTESTDMPVERPEEVERRTHALRATGGGLFAREMEPGWVGRLDLALYDQYSPYSGGSFITFGVEGWKGPDGWGVSVPHTLQFGFEHRWVFVSLGLGFDLLSYDNIQDESGWGFLAPGALACVGLNLDDVRFGAHVQGRYRWQISAIDQAQLLTALFFEIPLWKDAPRARPAPAR